MGKLWKCLKLAVILSCLSMCHCRCTTMNENNKRMSGKTVTTTKLGHRIYDNHIVPATKNITIRYLQT